MTDHPDETIHGPVESVISQLLYGFEGAMWAEKVSAAQATRVLNRVTFGHPEGGGRAGVVRDVPPWAEKVAELALQQIHQEVGRARELPGEEHLVEADVRLVTMVLVRRVLHTVPDIFGQVLGGG